MSIHCLPVEMAGMSAEIVSLSPDGQSEVCPCGCGHPLPAPVTARWQRAGRVMELWVEAQGFTMGHVKQPDHTPLMVEMRRQIAIYLRQHGWSLLQIGDFLDRHHTTILSLLRGRSS